MILFALGTILLSFLLAEVKNDNTTSTRKPVKLNMKQALAMNQVLAFYGLEKTSTAQCKNDVEEFKNGLRYFDSWALKMFDSSSKLQAGILNGNLVELGNFAECVNIKFKNITGKHCLLKIQPPLNVIKTIVMYKNLSRERWEKMQIIVNEVYLHWSICVPKSCNSSDVLFHFNKTIVEITVGLDLGVSLEKKHCVTLEDYPKLGTIQYIIGTFLIIFPTLSLIATAMELTESKNAFVESFSFITNYKRITSEGTANDLDCLHGVRILSTCYVVIGHRYLLKILYPLTNTLDIIDWTNSIFSTFIIAGGVCVDSFFLISGTLVSYGFFNYVTKTNHFNLLFFYLRRYIRITVPLMFAVVFYVTYLQFFGSGPLFLDTIDTIQKPCQQYWWSTILHIQSYINPDRVCILQVWYLSCDMLYYFLSPIILIPLWKAQIIGYVVLFGSFVISIAISFYVAWVQKFEGVFPISNQFLTSKYFTTHYVVPHTRAAPYLIGIAFGYVLFKLKGRQIKSSLLTNFICWLITFFLMIFATVGVHGFLIDAYQYNQWKASLFLAVSRSAWTIGLVWIIWTCVNGQGGVVNYFLCLYGFKVMGRISYGIYLFHMSFQFLKDGSEKSPLYFSNLNAIRGGISDLLLSSVIGFFFTIFIELPIIKMESLIFNREPKNKINVTPVKQ